MDKCALQFSIRYKKIFLKIDPKMFRPKLTLRYKTELTPNNKRLKINKNKNNYI